MEALEAVGNLSAYGRLIEPEEIASTKFACEIHVNRQLFTLTLDK